MKKDIGLRSDTAIAMGLPEFSQFIEQHSNIDIGQAITIGIYTSCPKYELAIR